MNIIPVITLHEPWATLVIDGIKTIESRVHDRFKSLVGKRIGIHAGKTTNYDELLYACVPERYYPKNKPALSNGYLLGTVYVDSSRELDATNDSGALISCGTYVKRYGLFLSHQEKFGLTESHLMKGELGIWYVDLDTMQKVKKP